jgi:hypothetical protein
MNDLQLLYDGHRDKTSDKYPIYLWDCEHKFEPYQNLAARRGSAVSCA